MASVQCFQKAEKSYYRQSQRDHRKEEAMSRTEGNGQRENYDCMAGGGGHFTGGLGFTAGGLGMSAGLGTVGGLLGTAVGTAGGLLGFGAEDVCQKAPDRRHHSERKISEGRNDGRYLTQYAENHHGEPKTSKGRNDGRCLAQYAENHSMGQNNGRYLAQRAKGQSLNQVHGHKKEYSSCHMKSSEAEHQKKGMVTTNKAYGKSTILSREYKSGDSSCNSESESDDDRF
ncbi:hypothetical protein BT93_D2053 [Corymbia citriodora subsp. variegata]|nr:hypothetical protein BT93_D2053 [Corymbia citriodora subsp. variegata]KAF8033328.1 hypothetical protein BT93_D2053 [Corymbia citriodora subsp. variegata]